MASNDPLTTSPGAGFDFGWEPGMVTALVFSILAVAAPSFIIQPGMGMGIMTRRAPKPCVSRAHYRSSHVFFRLGHYIAVLITRSSPGREQG